MTSAAARMRDQRMTIEAACRAIGRPVKASNYINATPVDGPGSERASGAVGLGGGYDLIMPVGT